MSKANYTETEVKMYVPDLAAVARRLEQCGAVLVRPRVLERNVRYENAEKSLTPSGIVVRLRQDARVWLTYKSPGIVRTGSIRSRFEAEVEVSSFETMETILGQLGYYPHLVYEKYRTAYLMEKDELRAEILLDEMPYGNFVEIEGDSPAIERMVNLLELQTAPRYSASYTVLFEYVKQHLGLNFQHLTFHDFADISVSESAFHPPGEQ